MVRDDCKWVTLSEEGSRGPLWTFDSGLDRKLELLLTRKPYFLDLYMTPNPRLGV